jgi:hypothetical protein
MYDNRNKCLIIDIKMCITNQSIIMLAFFLNKATWPFSRYFLFLAKKSTGDYVLASWLAVQDYIIPIFILNTIHIV